MLGKSEVWRGRCLPHGIGEMIPSPDRSAAKAIKQEHTRRSKIHAECSLVAAAEFGYSVLSLGEETHASVLGRGCVEAVRGCGWRSEKKQLKVSHRNDWTSQSTSDPSVVKS